jgi:hypothetical protein
MQWNISDRSDDYTLWERTVLGFRFELFELLGPNDKAGSG